MMVLICSRPDRFRSTVLGSSRLLIEIYQMATHVVIRDHGELLFQDSLSSLHQHSRTRIRIRTTDDGRACRILARAGLPVRQNAESGELLLDSAEDADVLRGGRILSDQDIGLLRLEEKQMSLEDIFLKLTGKKVSL